ncbi:MAG: GNAT family N-acetyltransferase [Actinomycetaceae bacterium]|nr:GNAT family N-acetyltransferase [Actinomycetaceae bacterium]
MSNSVTVRTVTTSSDLLACFTVRYEVFVKEQEVPFILEIDARDYLPSTVHLLVSEGEQPLGTLRIIQDSEYSYHLGRISVLKHARGRGLGRLLVLKAHEALAKKLLGEPECGAGEGAGEIGNGRMVEITLDAQEYAIEFYERLGYELTDRERFLDAGIWHREMKRTLSVDS